MGVRFDFVKGEGPAIENPLRSEADVAAVRRFEPRDALSHVLVAIRQIKQELAGRVPLIGFAGAPFTLASYAIEGGHSANFAHTKALMYGSPDTWHKLCDLLSEMMADYLIAQIEAGVDAVQLFDSWVGVLNAEDYREFILPHTRAIFDRLSAYDVPTIHFGVSTGAILGELRAAGGQVIGADWRIPLDDAWARIGFDRAIQGNLDPTVLLAPIQRILSATDDVLDRAGGRPGHIFNLGHGILPMTPIEHVQAVARYVHQQTRR
jgi:uroporphyrinogen decarboxylase